MANLMSHGISEDDTEAEITRDLQQDFLNKGQRYHTVCSSLSTWTFEAV